MNPILDDTDLALNVAQAITNPPITADAITAEADESAAVGTTDETPKSAVTEPPFFIEDAYDILTSADDPPSVFTGPARAIASTLPELPPSDPVLPDGAGDAVTDEVAETLTSVTAVDGEVSEVTVTSVPEPETVITPDTPERKKKRQAKRDLFAATLRAEGLGEAVIAKLVVQREILHGRQRVHPTWQTVCSPVMIAFWATRINKDGVTEERTDADIEADMIKLVRNDGGQIGPEARYLQLIEEASSAAKAAVAIAQHVGQRIKSIRLYVVSAVNELRRRRAVVAGIDPTTVAYLAVR